jgi:hypothetical protein
VSYAEPRHRVTVPRLACLVAALGLLGALAPAGALAVSDPDAGYHATWTVRDHDGLPRLDGRIAVGDDLEVTFGAVDGTALTSCQIRLISAGGWLMQTPAPIANDTCTLMVRLPDFPDPADRLAMGEDSIALDLCVKAYLTFADDQARTLIAGDRTQPGGRTCYDGSDHGFDQVLDFPVEPGGTPRAFISNPPMMSWNPSDWGTGMTPLTFGVPWHYEAPAWVDTCQPYLNGSWTTVIRPLSPAGCASWDLRLPGVLPSTLPWTGDAGDWDLEIVSSYTAALGQIGALTITKAHVPIAPSDSIFESSQPAIFPVDLATTRFVTEGQPWRPVFEASGGTLSSCTLTVYTIPPTWPNDPLTSVDYADTAAGDSQCTFDVPAFGPNESHQIYVNGEMAGGQVTYGGSISSIPVPEPPTIEPPTETGGGDTDIGVAPGDGQGLGLTLDIGLATPAGTWPGSFMAHRDRTVCKDSILSTNLESGGAIPHLDTRCGLDPGTYLATATMVDAAGTITRSTRTFTVLSPRPQVVSRTPAPGVTGVARNVRPSVTFDIGVSGVSGSSMRLLDTATGTYAAATVAYDATLRRATLRPSALLAAGHTYRLSLTSGIKSLAGRSLAATSWTFKVTTDATRPTYTPTPAPYATGVSRTANVSLKFSELVLGVSGSRLRLQDATSGAYVTATVTYDAVNRRAILNPSSALLSRHKYRVVVYSGITDRAGNSVRAGSWTFTTSS